MENNNLSCEGKEPPFDHPKIYLKQDNKGDVSCPYCGKVFSPI